MKTCIIIPCWLPKIQSLRDYLHSIGYNEKTAIYIAVSNAYEKNIFENMFQKIPNLMFFDVEKYLIDNKFFISKERLKENCVINLKKFATLHMCLNLGYNYMLCFDSDTKNLGNIEKLTEQAITNYNKRVYFGIDTTDNAYLTINYESAKLSNCNKYLNIYAWFFDIPIYEKQDLKDFFEYFGDFENLAQKLNWHSFDHLVYMYFLLKTDKAKIINYRNEAQEVPEFLSLYNLEKIKEKYNYFPLWMTKKSYLESLSLQQKNIVFMLSHVDR